MKEILGQYRKIYTIVENKINLRMVLKSLNVRCCINGTRGK